MIFANFLFVLLSDKMLPPRPNNFYNCLIGFPLIGCYNIHFKKTTKTEVFKTILYIRLYILCFKNIKPFVLPLLLSAALSLYA